MYVKGAERGPGERDSSTGSKVFSTIKTACPDEGCPGGGEPFLSRVAARLLLLLAERRVESFREGERGEDVRGRRVECEL